MSDFHVGCYVKIKGLASKPQYNGFTGRIFVEKNEDGRWGVEFFFLDRVNDRKTILAKECHLISLNEIINSPRQASSGKVLLVDGFGMFSAEESFMTKALLGSDPAFFKDCGVVHVAFDSEKPETGDMCERAILAACANPADIRAIVVSDLSVAFEDALQYIAHPLNVFTRKHHGTVLFPTTEGGRWCDEFLQPVFGDVVEWQCESYYRATHAAVKRNRSNVGKFFEGMQDLKFSVKGSMLRNVPTCENFFATSQDCKLFRAWADDYEAANDMDEERNSVIVAVKSGGLLGGTIAYFGDVNAEPESQRLMVKLLRKSPICMSILEGTSGSMDVADERNLEVLSSTASEVFRSGELPSPAALKAALEHGIVSVKFAKVFDGQTLMMRCTRKLDLIPDKAGDQHDDFESAGAFRVFSMRKSYNGFSERREGWRSFRYDNVDEIRFESQCMTQAFADAMKTEQEMEMRRQNAAASQPQQWSAGDDVNNMPADLRELMERMQRIGPGV